MKPNQYTTSTKFDPENISHKHYYHHKKLDPKDKDGWNKGTCLLVRNTQKGIDYTIQFIEDGSKITAEHFDYNSVKHWKYYAKYTLIEKSINDSEKRRYIPKEMERSILKAQSNLCAFCEEKLDNNTVNFDHILEMACGGRTKKENLQAICKDPCHDLKTYIFKKLKKKGFVNQYDWSKNTTKTFERLEKIKQAIQRLNKEFF